MKKTIFLLLVLISLILIGARLLTLPINQFLGNKEKSGIKVLSLPEGMDVYLDEQLAGKTPYQNDNLAVKEYLVKIKKADLTWQNKLLLTSGTLTVVNRELNKEASSSAGEVLTLEKGSGVFINSWPGEATVEIDGKAVGQTPLINNISQGDHNFVLSKSGFLKRSIKATIPENFRLDLNVDLAVAELDLSTISSPVISSTPMVVVKTTPTGFLRVRDKPSLNGVEIAQVKPGDELVLLEEAPGWDKVRLSDGKEGYVSVSYISKKPSSP